MPRSKKPPVPGIKRRIGTPARQLLKTLSASVPPVSADHLPLVHVTEVGAAREIVDRGQIETRDCSVFAKKLTYFFVLRPAYRPKKDNVKSDHLNHFPFVFIVSPEHLGSPFHVYPFDTGGADSGMFDERADRHVMLEDFELEPSLLGAKRHISWAFGTLDAYFDGELKPDLARSLKPWDDVPLSFIAIAKLAALGANRADRRASAIEVAYRDHVRLKGNVRLIILPKQYLEDGDSKNTEFMKKLKKADIDWITYNWQPNTTPEEYSEQINRLAREHFTKTGTL